MKTIIDEYAAKRNGWNVSGWNLIKCDACNIEQDLKRTPSVEAAREEARALGWKTAEGNQIMDLCPHCRGN